jgi:hypothetical protein
VAYHHEVDSKGDRIPDAPLPGPTWLRSLIGDHAFLRLRFVGTYTSDENDLRLMSEFPSIETLSLDEQVNDKDMRFVAPLRNLKKLELSSPYLSDHGIKNLSGLHKLEELTIGHARLTDDGLKQLGSLKNLKELVLIQTQVTAEGMAWLRKQIPAAQIELAPVTIAPARLALVSVDEMKSAPTRFVPDKLAFVSFE